LMRLLFRSRLAILCSLCCALRTARRHSVTALFRLKIASSGRGALAGTRWEHSTATTKGRRCQPEWKTSEKIDIATKTQNKREALRR
jgi:hypothetical protein